MTPTGFRASTIVIAIILALLFHGTVTAQAADQPALSPEHSARIKASCTAAKASLSQLHRADGLLRVNRGQTYEYIGTGLMAHFNSRLALNGLDAKDFIEATLEYNDGVQVFRESYKAYEVKLSSVLRIDCHKQPGDFYYGLVDARKKRAEVYKQVQQLRGTANDYLDVFNNFSVKFESEQKKGDA